MPRRNESLHSFNRCNNKMFHFHHYNIITLAVLILHLCCNGKNNNNCHVMGFSPLLSIKSQRNTSFATPREISTRSLFVAVDNSPQKMPSSSSSKTATLARLLPSSSFRNTHRLHLSSTTTTTNENNNPPIETIIKPLLSTLSFIIMDVTLRRVFKAYALSFPSSLAGCGVLFFTLLSLNLFGDWGDKFYDALTPGATVLAKWLPVFFVPSLVTLPLAPSVGNAMELAKVTAVLTGGFLFSLLTTSWSVMGIRKLCRTTTERPTAVAPLPPSPKSKPPSKKKGPFSNATFYSLLTLTATSGLLNIIKGSTTSLFQSLFFLFTTLSTFVFGTRLPPKITKIIHPLVSCTTLTWTITHILSYLSSTGMTFQSYLSSYKINSLSLSQFGAGDVLLFLLGPAVISLACQMYNRKQLIKDNLLEVSTALATAITGGLFGTALTVRLINLSSPLLRLSLLSRNITSPLAMSIASLFNLTDASLAVVMVVLSGLIGANFGPALLDAFGVTDPVARGLGMGSAAHGLGTAALAGSEREREAFPFAAIAMALVGGGSTCLVSVGVVRRFLVRVALG